MLYNGSVAELVRSAIVGTVVPGKIGRDVLQGQIAAHLQKAGLVADKEDTKQFLRAAMPVWRSKDNSEIERTAARRLIDIVAYAGEQAIALIEIESDLNDLRQNGVTRRNGHYDVYSISADEKGEYFNSYKSLERMAAAAIYHSWFMGSGNYPTPDEAIARLQALRSDDPAAHNPAGFELILVSGRCRAMDRPLLSKRLTSLRAQLICVTQGAH